MFAPHPPPPLTCRVFGRDARCSAFPCAVAPHPPAPFSHKGRRGSLGILMAETGDGTQGLAKKSTPVSIPPPPCSHKGLEKGESKRPDAQNERMNAEDSRKIRLCGPREERSNTVPLASLTLQGSGRFPVATRRGSAPPHAGAAALRPDHSLHCGAVVASAR